MINKTDMRAGLVLTAKYKKLEYACNVTEGDGGKLLYTVGVSAYKSPSAAGSAVMGGIACNGWRFWSIGEGAGEPTGDVAEVTQQPTDSTKVVKLFKRVANQKGAPEGAVRWWCNGCASSFIGTPEYPAGCQNGHYINNLGEVAAIAS